MGTTQSAGTGFAPGQEKAKIETPSVIVDIKDQALSTGLRAAIERGRGLKLGQHTDWKKAGRGTVFVTDDPGTQQEIWARSLDTPQGSGLIAIFITTDPTRGAERVFRVLGSHWMLSEQAYMNVKAALSKFMRVDLRL